MTTPAVGVCPDCAAEYRALVPGGIVGDRLVALPTDSVRRFQAFRPADSAPARARVRLASSAFGGLLGRFATAWRSPSW